MSHKATNTNSEVYLDENGIFCIEWSTEQTLEVDDFKTVVDIYDEWSAGSHWRVLHIFPKGATASSEARNYGAKREKRAGAEAFVIQSPVQRNLFKLYRRLRSVQYPMREFSSVEKAKAWLMDCEMPVEEEA